MENYARGDSKRVTCSSEDDEGYRARVFISATTIQRMSQLNFRDMNHNFIRVSGQVQPILISRMFDETDCQCWAEDELSSSESKIRLVGKRKRRRSVAYRNQSIHRSRSALFQSSSSHSASTYLKIPTAHNFCNSQKQRRSRSRYYREIKKKAKLQRELICLVKSKREPEVKIKK